MEKISYDTLPLVLSIKELAEVLNIGINTAYALVRKKEVRSVRIGRQYRVSRDALKAYLEKYA